MSFLSARKLVKTYSQGKVEIPVLRGVDFELEEGALVGIYGASGSGKSTLLHLLGGLDRATAGGVFIDGASMMEIDEEERARIRNRSIGFVFQFFHLLPELSALENAMLPCLISGMKKEEAKRVAMDALQEVGLEARASHRPSELSGGEQQRVAVLRASIMNPRVFFADEPTGSLDRESGEKVWELLMRLHREKRSAMVVVTHNPSVLGRLPVRYELRDGVLWKD